MTTPNDGGPAYPVTPTDRSGQIAETFCGMTMRQAYKIAALQGMLSNRKTTEHSCFTRDDCVGEAGHYADAMLDEDAAHAAKQEEKL